MLNSLWALKLYCVLRYGNVYMICEVRKVKTTKPYAHTVFTATLKSTVSRFYREEDHMIIG